jgi:hypothetical protein
MFSHIRNACVGQLHMAKTNLNNMYNSDLVTSADKYELTVALSHINTILNRWDKHYAKKVFEQLEKAKLQKEGEVK